MLLLIVLFGGCTQLQKSEPILITGKTKINRSGTYVLNGNISCSGTGEADYCIGMWTADDIVLDCQGHTVDGEKQRGPASAGIMIVGASAEIRNCNIQNSYFGIFLKSDNCIFNNNTISNSGIAVYLDDMANYNYFTNNTVTDNSKGINIFMRSSNNTFTNNTIRNNELLGIDITCGSNFNVFSNNIIENNGFGGIGDEIGGVFVINSYANIFSNNRICKNAKSIECKFNVITEGQTKTCQPQAEPSEPSLAYYLSLDLKAQEAGNLIDGGGNICSPEDLTCENTLKCNIGC